LLTNICIYQRVGSMMLEGIIMIAKKKACIKAVNNASNESTWGYLRYH